MRIVLDSSIICADLRMDGSSFRTFLEGLEQAGHSLFVPRIVLDEVINKYREKIEDCVRKIEQSGKELAKLTGAPAPVAWSQAEVQESVKNYTANVERTLRRVSATVVDYPSVSHQLIVKRALDRKKPFSRDGKAGYRDSLIWENVLELAVADGDDVAFICNNPKDFADENGDLHEDLTKDIQGRYLQPDRVRLHGSLESFNAECILPALERLDRLQQQLNQGQYPDVDLISILQDSLPELLEGKDPRAFGFGLTSTFEDQTISCVEAITGVVVTGAFRLSDSQYLLLIDAQAECSFEFFVYKPQAWDEDEPFEIMQDDWNEYYALAATTRDVRIAVSLTMDELSNQLTSVEVESVSGV